MKNINEIEQNAEDLIKDINDKITGKDSLSEDERNMVDLKIKFLDKLRAYIVQVKKGDKRGQWMLEKAREIEENEEE